ncbi:Urb2/Npa2 family protein [Thalictrum thalictroides]|uniref:Urb2/Npa2 family protein n=1 Tax=Thalictrum thalictroides TaxID=46969 RepID=A0A7J6VZQ3_THATH|nr:Urb2/Npa2 family protein [Thalictrum thalictroides]
MVDVETKPEEQRRRSRKSNKRKLRTSSNDDDKFERDSKTHRTKQEENIDEEEVTNLHRNRGFSSSGDGIWENLDLILSLDNKQLHLQRRVELALNFVNSTKLNKKELVEEDFGKNRETVSLSRVITFLNGWIQSLLIPAENKKKNTAEQDGCLDFRCWEVFKFCLEECLSLGIQLNVSLNLLRSFSCVVRIALGRKDLVFTGEDYGNYSLVCDCVILLFSHHRGAVLNANFDLWVSLVIPVVELVQKIYTLKVAGNNMGALLLRFSCLVLEPFSSFLRVHPSPKNIFPVFVDKLLEPFLALLAELYLQSDRDDSTLTRNLLNMVEDILSNGLFHPVHVDGFLTTHTVETYIESDTVKVKNSKPVVKSYHRHFFKKLEKIMSEKVSALGAVGRLFHLFTVRVKKQMQVSVLSDAIGMAEMVSGFSQESGTGSITKFCAGNTNVALENTHLASRLDAETSKSLFGLFVHFMDPLMLHLKHYSKATLEGQHDLVSSISSLKSINKILVSFSEEKIYARAEDDSEGACLSYLKDIFQIVISFSAKVRLTWLSSVKTDGPSDMLPLLAKELIDSLGHFLEIDYEVIENDLVSLWMIIFIFSEIDQSQMKIPDKGLLTSHILRLGSRLINIYSELRQVNKPIFALCKAVRLFGFGDNLNEIAYSRFIAGKVSSSLEVCVQPIIMLFTSQDFRTVISNAIKSIPEGQVSVCIQQLKIDISESLEWMKVTCLTPAESIAESCSMSALHLQAELFGRVLTEIYTLILDYSAVTTGNSILVGNTIKDLVTVVRPSLSKLVGKYPNSVSEFLVSVFGRKVFIKMPVCVDNTPPLEPSSIWIFMFFFRVYMSCQILLRQSIKLMPPDLSRKTSKVTGNLMTAYCGKDWMDAVDWNDDAYFSWIIEPSDSLMNIIQSVSDSCLKDNTSACAPLAYVLHAMALQRLVDLNRKIKSFEYLHEKFARLAKKTFMDDATTRQCRKERKKYDKRISVLKQEAMDITSFLMTYLPVIVRKVHTIFADNYDDCERHEGQKAHNAWDMSICSLTEKLQPTAIWWILCQNTDVWCAHATKKNLKKFLSCLLQNSSSFISSSENLWNQIGSPDNLRMVTLPQVSLVLLSDTVFHEESFLCRYLTSRFCHVLEKSVLLLFNDSLIKDADLKSTLDWDVVLKELEEMPFVLGKVCVKSGPDILVCVKSGPDILPSKFLSLESRKQIAICQNLLSLLSWVPKVHMELKYFSVYATYILNLERLVVFSLLRCCGESCMEKQTELLSLFVYSRKALKWLVMAYCDKQIEIGQSSSIPVLCESSFSILWLLKSVSTVVQCMHGCSEENIFEVKHMIFSLMDHNSYLFLTLSKFQCRRAVSLLQLEVTKTEISLSSEPSSEVTSMDPDSQFETTGACDVWEVVVLMAETLKEQMQSLHVFLKTKLPVVDIEIWSSVFNRLSSLISGFQGFLWGLASVLNEIDLRSTKIFLCIHEFEDFINFCLSAIIVEDHPQSGTFCGNPSAPLPDCTQDSLSDKLGSGDWIKSSSEDIISAFGTRNSKPRKKKSQVVYAENAVTILTDANFSKRQKLKIPLLQSLLSGEKSELAYLIRELFTASSAILRLKLKFGHCKSSSNSMAVFIWTSQFLLSEMIEMVATPHPFSFVWLDGVVKYIEVLGIYISLIDTPLSNNAYAKLINIHLRTIGKCITLQGKVASLASHEYESNTKTLEGQTGPWKFSTGNVPFGLDEFKAGLRMSFGVLIKKPQIWTALQVLERALVGLQEGCSNYEINTGLLDVGKVSSTAAAAVDCFDLVLESLSGRKHVDAVKTYTEKIIGALFNIVLHLQGPLIFYGNLSGDKGDNDPDPGSVILMCIEVLTKVAGKPYLFQMHSCHIGQSFHVPATLFQDFHMIRSSQTPIKLYSEISYPGAIAGSFSYVADHRFSVDLFAACCRLLWTVLRHRKSESERCMANLQSSVCVLLHCLETVDTGFTGEIGNFSWKLHEGIKCASFLRRIYEEIRQQKEKLKQYCSFFLSNYITICSGNGPSKRGIRREIDEALRPGVYALMDACSPEDLQQLHTNLGEGPSQRTLADLQRDYKQNFQYEGKV